MKNQPEGLTFINYYKKPSIGRIQRYLDNRLQPTHETGLTISHDFLGNAVTTSLEHKEQTLGGMVPSAFIASQEGKHIITTNPGILSKIYTGTISHKHYSWGGIESKVYQVILQTDNGPEKFALKYTFPINELGGVFTSGIIAMRLMQLADRERPVPYIHYSVPIFATHDITVSPFVSDGISVYDLLSWIDSSENNGNDWSFLKEKNLTSRHKQLIRTMKNWEFVALKDTFLTFKYHVKTVLNSQKEILRDWVNTQSFRYPEFNLHRYNTFDTSLNQSIVNLENIFELYQSFNKNQFFNSSDPTFIASLLGTLSLVELGIGLNKLNT